MIFQHKFVKNIPENIEDSVLYVSIDFATAIHKCACGCGNEVVTPFSPTDWELIFNGKTVSLYPSIGNWSFPCQSHYWIINSEIKWVPKWARKKINRSRNQSSHKRKTYLDNKKYSESWLDFFRKK